MKISKVPEGGNYFSKKIYVKKSIEIFCFKSILWVGERWKKTLSI